MFFGRKVEVSEFESAALPHRHDLYRTALRVLGDTGTAQDLVQETYLHAWKSFHRFEPGTNCRAWLFKILFHRIHHHRRRWFNSKMVSDSEEVLEHMPGRQAALPDKLGEERILEALDKIPPDFRAVVLLADVQEFSYKEVAETLNIPVGTVMSRLSRARRLLRGHLAAVAESYGIPYAQPEGLMQ